MLSDGDRADHLPNVRNILERSPKTVDLDYGELNKGVSDESRYQGNNDMISMLNRLTHEQKRVINKSSICVFSSGYIDLLGLRKLPESAPPFNRMN